ncbi:MAG: hypothetical protein NT106_09710 [Candidatus Sumerlaeota bacterium]|nr:hypothetical protein [Candidatus Sumerlaeota bacterium]
MKIDRVFSISIFALFLLFSSVSTPEEKNRHSPESHQPSLSPHSQPTIFSVQMHTLTGGFEQHKRSVDLIKAAGICQVRDECFWHLVEKEKGVYQVPESVLRNLDYSLENGLDTLIILNYANPLYDEGMAPTSPPAVKAFGQYCFTMARALKGKVRYFEVWNEPNVDGFWRPKSNPVAYARLLKEAYLRIKEGNPDTIICGVSLAGIDDEKFLQGVIDEGGYDFMDVLSLHPYCHPKTPEDARIFERMASLRARLAERCGKPPRDIWVTEVGWPTNLSGGVTEYEQGVRVARAYLNAFAYPFIRTVFIYWFGPDGPDREWAEDCFGMVRQDCSPKLSYIATKTLASALDGIKFEGALMRDENNARILHFSKKDGSHIYAIWGLKDYTDVVASCKGDVRAIYLNGGENELSPYKGAIGFRIGDLPLLLLTREVVDWDTSPTKRMAFQFDGNTNILPRGQGCLLKIVPPVELRNAIFSFEMEETGGLSFERRPGGWMIRADAKAVPGIAHFRALVTPAGEKLPAALIQGEAQISQPVDISLSPLLPEKDSRNFVLSVKNLSLEKISGAITLTSPPGVLIDKTSIYIPTISPNATFNERIGILSRHDADEVFEFTAKALLNSGVCMEIKELLTFYECVRTDTPLEIDGNLSDWPRQARPVHLGSKEQYIAGYVKWNGPEDSSARVYTAWDDKWFYLAAEFQDDILSSPCAGFSVYNNDGIEIYLDADYEGDRQLTHYTDDDFQYGFFIERGRPVVYSWSQLKDYSRDSRIALNLNPQPSQTLSGLTFKGMILEGAIPMREFNLRPLAGLHIGFGLAGQITKDK